MNLPPGRVTVDSVPVRGRYPTELERDWEPAGGPRLHLRALRPDDIEREIAFVSRLSAETLYLRVQYAGSVPTRRDFERLLDVDYFDRLAVGALLPEGAAQQIVGVSRYARIADTTRAECAVVVVATNASVYPSASRGTPAPRQSPANGYNA